MSAVYCRAKRALWRRAGDQVLVLMAEEGSEVICLSGSGLALWDVLADAVTGAEAARRLAEIYLAAPERVLEDILPILNQLLGYGVIEAVDLAPGL